MKDVLVKVKRVGTTEISPYISNHREAAFWLSWTWVIKKLLKATETSDGEYEFTVGDVTYIATKEDSMSESDLEFYADSTWRSAFELPFLKLGTV